MDSFDILKSLLEYEKTLQKSRSSKKKEVPAKEQVIAYQLMDSNSLLAHTLTTVNERSFDLARSSPSIFMNELNLETRATLTHYKLTKTLEFKVLAEHH